MQPELLKAFVSSEYPFPIAYSFRRALDKKDSREEICRVLLNTLEYLAQILIADYLSREDREPDLDTELMRMLNTPPAAGVWQDWIRRILLDFRARSRAPLVSELAAIGESKAQRDLKRLIEWRNRWVHDRTPVDLGQFRRRLFGLLDRIHPIHKSSLICPKSTRLSGALHFTKATLLKGDNPHFAEIECRSSTPLEDGKVHLYASDSRELISLHPFVIYCRCGQCGEHHYFHFNRPAGRRIVFTSIPGGHSRTDTEAYLALEQLFRQPKSRRLRPRHFSIPGTLAALPRTLRAGDRVGPYEIEELIRIGGAAQIYRASDSRNGQVYALKLLPVELSRDPLLLMRFDEEARNLRRMNHPNVVPLHDVGEDFGDRYLVMDLAIGGTIGDQSLRDLSEIREPLPEEIIIAIGRQICEGLHHIHSQGVVHRDLKPGNLLVTENRVVLADFGVSRARGESKITLTGLPVGTPEYMAPEQIREEEVDARTDVYALGCVLYGLATGRPPFRADTPLTTALYHLQASPPRIENLNPRISTGLANIIYRALHKKPEFRYQSAREIFDHLIRAGEDPAGPQVIEGETTPQDRLEEVEAREKAKYRKRLRASRAMIGIVIALAVLSLMALGLAYRDDLQQRAEESEARELLARRYLYAARIHMAMEAWENAFIKRCRDLLGSLKPQEGEEDVRGFEWYYLWELLHQESFSVQLPGTGLLVTDISRDGRLLAAGRSQTARVWDRKTREKLATIEVDNHISWLTFSPDGATLALAVENTVQLWVADSAGDRTAWRRSDVSVESAPGMIHELVISPDGKRLLGGIADGSVRIWNLESGRQEWSWFPPKDAAEDAAEIRSVDFSPTGETIALASEDSTVWIGRPASDEAFVALPKHSGPVAAVAFSPDGSVLASVGRDGILRLWDVVSERPRISFEHDTGLFAVVFSPQKDLLACASGDRTIRIRDAKSFAELRTIKVYSRAVGSLAFSDDGEVLAAGDLDGALRMWDLARLRQGPVSVKETEEALRSVAWVGGSEALVAADRDLTVRRWDLSGLRDGEGPELTWQFGFDGEAPESFTFSPDGELMVLARKGGELRILLTSDGQEHSRLGATKTPVKTMAFSPDSGLLLAATADGAISRWRRLRTEDSTPWDPQPPLRTELENLDDLALDPGKTKLAAVEYRSPEVVLWDIALDRQLAVLKGHSDWVIALAFTADSSLLATGGLDRTIKVWDVSSLEGETAEPLQKFSGHGDAVACLTFGPDGSSLISGSDDGTIKFWDVSTGQERATFREHRGHVNDLVLSPDGSMLVTVGGTAHTVGEMKIWIAATVGARR